MDTATAVSIAIFVVFIGLVIFLILAIMRTINSFKIKNLLLQQPTKKVSNLENEVGPIPQAIEKIQEEEILETAESFEKEQKKQMQLEKAKKMRDAKNKKKLEKEKEKRKEELLASIKQKEIQLMELG